MNTGTLYGEIRHFCDLDNLLLFPPVETSTSMIPFDISTCVACFYLQSFSIEQWFEPFHILHSFSLFIYCVVFSQLIYGPSGTMDPVTSIPPTFVCLFVCVFLFLFLFTFHDDIVNTDQRPWGMRLNVQWEKEWKSLKRKLLNLNHQRPCHSLVYRLSSSGTYFLYLHISRLVYFVPSFF